MLRELSQETQKRISGFFVLELDSKNKRWKKIKKIKRKKVKHEGRSK